MSPGVKVGSGLSLVEGEGRDEQGHLGQEILVQGRTEKVHRKRFAKSVLRTREETL